MTTNTVTINLDDMNIAEILKNLVIDAGLSIHDLFDDDDVIAHVQEGGIPVDAIYEEDELRENEMIQKMLEEEREELNSDGWAKVEERDEEIEELQKKVAELTEQMRFLDPNGKPCDRCNEPVCYEGNDPKISENDGEIICGECYSREVEEAKHNAKYTWCESCCRNCYTGGNKYPDGYTCDDCEEDEVASDADTEDDE
jgi:antitoxin component of RelBE/YafQ-DinJ toxin-antitoxin module